MRICLAGGTGSIGRALIGELRAHDHKVTLLVRSLAGATMFVQPGVDLVAWDGKRPGDWMKALERSDALVNLAGATIGRRWTIGQKERIRSSRLSTTHALADALVRSNRRPRVFINASAVGYYGNVPNGEVTEDSPKGGGFLADVCEEWERAATEPLRAFPDVRVVLLRTGIVLDQESGALRKLLIPFRLFVGGPFGSGRQWFPWIHIADEVGAIRFLLEHPVSGPVNCSAPAPVTMREFCAALGRVLHRPSWLPVPRLALKLLLGEMAGPLLLEGQRMVPTKLMEAGYVFRFPGLDPGLADLLGRT